MDDSRAIVDRMDELCINQRFHTKFSGIADYGEDDRELPGDFDHPLLALGFEMLREMRSPRWPDWATEPFRGAVIAGCPIIGLDHVGWVWGTDCCAGEIPWR